MNRSILILILSILAVTTKVAAQDAFTPYIGNTYNYQVNDHAGSNYEWKVYDQLVPLTETDGSKYDFIGLTNTNSIQIKWLALGQYFLLVTETDATGCTNTKAVRIEAISNADKVLITSVSSSQCYALPASLNDVVIPLSFLDENDNPLAASDFDITVNYTLDGIAQPAQVVTFANQNLHISGNALSSDPVSNTPNTIVITSATDINNLPILPVPVAGQNTHTHTVLRDIIAPIVNNLATNTPRPTITGTAQLRAGETLTVVAKGFTYSVGDGYLSISGNNWSLAIPNLPGRPLSVGANTVTATITSSTCSTSKSGTGTVTVDLTRPTIDIQNEPVYVVNTNPYPVTIQFSEDVTGFTIDDILVANGTASDFVAVNANKYTIVVTPDGNGNIIINIPEAAATDLVGNTSIVAPQAQTRYDIDPPVVEIKNAPTHVTDLSPYTVTFDFSENVSDFDANDISVTNGSFSNFTKVADDEYTALITPNGSGNITIDVPVNSARDITGRYNDAPAQAITIYDSLIPGVAILNAPVAVNSNTPYTVTIQFTEDVTGFALSDITVGNGTASNFTTVDGRTYTADITSDGNGNITIDVAANVAQDAAGNNNTAASQVVTLLDTVVPQVSILNAPAIVNTTSPYTVTIQFTEDVTGFALNDITVGNGTASNFITVDGRTYTADITPDGNGNISIDVAAGVAQDAAGNNNTAASQVVTLLDTVVPQVSILNAPAIVNTTSPYTVTIQFTEDVTGFALSDITVGNGTASNFITVDGRTYTADITPDGNGNITIDVAANVAQDAAGNNNTAATQVVTLFDTGVPQVAILNAPAIVNTTSPYTVTIQFTEDVTGFALNDITVGNGTASNFITVDGRTYTADITPDGNGNISIDVAAGVAQDAAGNNNTAASQVVTLLDTVVPQVSILNAPAIVNTTSPYTVTIQFTEDVTGFALSDITVGNGTASNFITVDGRTYTADITPDGNGNITIDVAANVAQDAAGNNNTAATQVVTLFDTGVPQVAILNAPAIVNTTSPYTVTIQFTEDVTGFALSDITVGNGTASNFTTVDGRTYTADITPDGNGNITIDVAAGVAQDAAGNNNTAATQVVTIFDNVSPVIPTVANLVTDDTTPLLTGTASVGVGETLSVTVNGITYTQGDGNLTVAGTNWSLQIPVGNAIPDGLYDVTATVTDAATNSSTDITSGELKIRRLPTLTVISKECSIDLTTYTITFSSDGTVSCDQSYAVVGNQISNILSGTNVVLTATSEGLVTTLAVSAPNCACPVVAAPVSGGDKAVCFGTANPALSATVGAGETADWYDASTGGNLLVSGSTSYTSTETVAGTHSYFAETRNSTTGCKSSTRTEVRLTIYALPTITVSAAPICSADLLTYSVGVSVANGTVTSTAGTVVNAGGNNWTISGIASGTNITLTVTDTNNCVGTLAVSAPNCNCPVVVAPVSGGDKAVCFGTVNPALSATVGAGETADWYDAATGGNLLVSGSTSYTSTETLAGTYSYYAETRNSTTGCKSSTRTEVRLTIYAQPTITVSAAPICSADLLTYSVGVSVANGTVTSTAGTVVNAGGNNWTISGIASGTNITLTVTDTNNCVGTLAVSAPNCNCPVVAAPVSGGDKAVCFGTANPALSATVGAGETADWYDASTGGNLLVSGSTSYTSTETLAGTYSYYAETRNSTTGCNSSTRTEVRLTIYEQPTISFAQATANIPAGVAQTYSVNGNVAYVYQWQLKYPDNHTENLTSVTNLTESLTLTTTGTYLLTVKATNANNCESAVATKTITVSSNSSPVAVNDTPSTIETVPVSGNMLTNDSDPEGGALSVVSVGSQTNQNVNVTGTYGVLDWSADGSFNYTPNTSMDALDVNETVTDIFTYTIQDPQGNQASAQIQVSITGLQNTVAITVNSYCNNGLPSVSYSVTANYTVTSLSVKWIDSQSQIVAQDSGLPLNGTMLWPGAEKNSLGNAIDWPGWIFSGSRWVEGADGFEHTVPDASIQFSVKPGQNYAVKYPLTTAGCAPVPPMVAINDAITGSKNQMLVIPILNNDSGIPTGSTFSPTTATSVHGGTLIVNANNTISYVPALNYVGTDQFTYQVCDTTKVSRCAQATVSITIPLVNSSPVAQRDSYTAYQNTPLAGNVASNDSDPDGDALTFKVLTNPTKGTVSMNTNGSFTYTPVAGAKGTDQFVYQACDNYVCVDQYVDISFFNNEPVAQDDVFTTELDKTVNGSLKLNDSDPNSDQLTYVTTPIVAPQHGQLTILATGTFTYIPQPGYSGTDSFTYRVCDNGTPSKCSDAQATITVNKPLNHAPIAVNDINNTLINTQVTGNLLTNDYDPDGNQIAIITTPYASPSFGSVVIHADGTYVYTPVNNFEGEDVFMYVICEVGTSPILCDTAIVTIEVRPIETGNRAPVANEDEIMTAVNKAVSGNVLLNDFDPDQNGFSITQITSNVKNGTLTYNSSGTFTYTPNANFVGDDQFVYEICDNGTPSQCSRATATIKVLQPGEGNTAPFAADDAVFTTGSPINGDVSQNDSDLDGNKLTFSIFSNPAKGTLTMQADGKFVYTPSATASGADQFVYQVCDDGTPSKCSKATVYVTMIVNRTPVAINDYATLTQGESVTGNVLTNDSDPDNNQLSVKTTPITGAKHGSVTLSATGAYSYLPNASYVGKDSIVYEVCDNGIPSKCAQAKLVFTVEEIVGDRQATNDINTTIQDQSVTGNVLMNDNDYPVASSTVTVYQTPLNGSVNLSTNGDYTYTPKANFVGEDYFYYIVCNPEPPADCDTMKVTINVLKKEIKNGPIANNDETETTTNTPVASNLLANDYSPSNEPLSLNVNPISAPRYGTVVIEPNGRYTYTPATGYRGVDYFTYEVCGLITEICATATVTIQVQHKEEMSIFAADDAFFTYGTAISGNLLENDRLPANGVVRTNRNPVTAPKNGTITINIDGTFTYTPNDGFEGVDNFAYEICETTVGICDNATVNITVLPKPVIAADLSITKTAPAELWVGQTISYELTITNLGPSKATNVVVGDYLPVYILNPVYSLGTSSAKYPWKNSLAVESLALNEVLKITITGTVSKDSPTLIQNYASVYSDVIDPNFGNNLASAKTEINRSPFIVVAGGSDIAVGCCNKQGIILDASKTTGETDLHFKWEPALYLDNPFSATPRFTPGENIQYTLTVSDDNGLSSKQVINVRIADCPVAVTDGNVFVENASETILADASESTGTGLSYRWWSNDGVILNGQTNSTAQVSGLGKYYIEITDAYGCTDLDSLVVGLYIQAVNDVAQTELNTSVDINVLRNDIPQGAIDPASITITSAPKHGTAIVVADSLINYSPNPYFAGTDEFIYQVCDYFRNCDNANVLVIVNDETLFVPEAFSPNGDGVNDLFEIKGISGYTKVELEIVNRWGNKVYSSQNYGLGEGRDGYWDGVANAGLRLGQGPVPTGTYYYILQFNNGERVAGSVYIDR